MKRLHGYSEKWLEDKLAAGLKARGLENFHMSDPTKPGIPDRYVLGCGGLWIEVKQGKSLAALISGFDRQRTFMKKLVEGREKAMVCALLQPNGYTLPRLFLEPWTNWLKRERTAHWNKRGRTGLTGEEYTGLYRSPWKIEELSDLDPAWDHLIDMVK